MSILERRENLGGTWDLFKYPGIRSDSDMFTLGFRFKPWTSEKAIADGPSIMNYLKETVAEYGIDKHIRYSQKVVAADWSDEDNRWTVRIETDGEVREISCAFLLACSGYYNYDEGYTPEFAGRTTSRARSFIRSTGRRISTTRARRSSSSAVARPPSL